MWKILEINVPEAAAFQMVQNGKLVRDINRHGWRFFGNLDYGSFSHQWYEVSMAPMGVDAWTEKTLMPTFRVTENAVCCQCNPSGTRAASPLARRTDRAGAVDPRPETLN